MHVCACVHRVALTCGCVHMLVRARVHGVCVCVCARACGRACFCVHMCICVRLCTHALLQGCASAATDK